MAIDTVYTCTVIWKTYDNDVIYLSRDLLKDLNPYCILLIEVSNVRELRRGQIKERL